MKCMFLFPTSIHVGTTDGHYHRDIPEQEI